MDAPTIAGYIAAVVIFSFLGYIVYGFVQMLLGATREWRDEYALRVQNKVRGNEKVEYARYLQDFSFYRKLPDHLKMKFVLRVKNFIASKRFEGRNDLQVTDEMKTLIAAAAVQLTFGLNKYLLDRFSRIILFPESYYSPIGKNYHMGETNPRGVIVLSWKDLVNGFTVKDDAFNVGLHEMAHALELELLLEDDYDTYFGTYFSKWSSMAKSEYENVRNDRESFLREYAGVNEREFFAVCIEYFFESSAEFKSRLPQVYYHLCVLLNQDPMRDDTRVEQPARESFTHLRESITSYLPIFSTRFAWTIKNIGMWIIPAAFLLMGLSSGRFDIAIIPMAVLFPMSVIAYFKLNQLILYDQFLAVRSTWGRFKAVYYLDDIVTVSFKDDDDLDRLNVVLARDGKIFKRTHLYNSKKQDIRVLTSRLIQKGVLVK